MRPELIGMAWRRLGVLTSYFLLVAVVCVGMTHAEQSGEPMVLRFRPTQDEGRTIRTRKVDRIIHEDWAGKTRSWTYEFDKELRERVLRRDENLLERETSQLSGRMSYEGVLVDEARQQPVVVELIDDRGQEITEVENEIQVEPVRMRLILPDEPVSPGSTWSYTAPPSHRFPAPLTTEFELTGSREYRGRPCVIIRSRTAYEGTHEDRNVRVVLSSRGRILFDPETGTVINAVSSTRFDTQYLVDPEDGSVPRRLTKTIEQRFAEAPRRRR